MQKLGKREKIKKKNKKSITCEETKNLDGWEENRCKRVDSMKNRERERDI